MTTPSHTTTANAGAQLLGRPRLRPQTGAVRMGADAAGAANQMSLAERWIR